MASESPDMKKAKRCSKKRRQLDSDQKSEHLNSLPWDSSLPEGNVGDEDPFSLFIGSNKLEGGFLGLEEIDESEHGLEIPEPEVGNMKKGLNDKSKRKKRKNSERNDDTIFDGENVGEPDGDNGVREGDDGRQDKLKKKEKNKRKKNVKKMKNEDEKNDREYEVVEQLVGVHLRLKRLYTFLTAIMMFQMFDIIAYNIDIQHFIGAV